MTTLVRTCHTEQGPCMDLDNFQAGGPGQTMTQKCCTGALCNGGGGAAGGSAGRAVGIAAGVLMLVAIIGGVAFFIVKRRRHYGYLSSI